MSASPWAGLDVPALWSMAQAADTQMGWEQVRAWQRTYELLDAQQKQLQASRDELTAAWPPGRSTAAQSFAAYLDGVLQNIADAKLSALANRSALSSVLLSLSATKAGLAPLKAEWDKHEAERHDPAIQMTRGGGFAAQQALNAEARRLMEANDQEAREATNQMSVPRPLQPGIDDDATVIAGPGDGRPIGGSTPTRHSSGGWPSVPTIPSPAEVDASVGLAGTVPPPGPPVGVGTNTTPPAPVATQPPTGAHVVPSAPVGAGPAGSASRSAVAAGRRAGGHRSVLGAPSQLHTGPGAGVAARGRQVNPVGGVIGGQHGAAHPGGVPMAGGAAGRRGESRGGDVEHEPTLAWTVPTGRVPVIEAPVERPHQLGPGVIGIDR